MNHLRPCTKCGMDIRIKEQIGVNEDGLCKYIYVICDKCGIKFADSDISMEDFEIKWNRYARHMDNIEANKYLETNKENLLEKIKDIGTEITYIKIVIVLIVIIHGIFDIFLGGN